MRDKIWLIILLLVAGGIVLYFAINHNKSSTATSVTKYTHFDLAIKDAKLVGPVSIYLVNPGTHLEFSITSNILGKVSTPTDPAQTITMSASPLIFQFSAPTKAGSYQMAYQADGSTKVIEIGVVTVRATK